MCGPFDLWHERRPTVRTTLMRLMKITYHSSRRVGHDAAARVQDKVQGYCQSRGTVPRGGSDAVQGIWGCRPRVDRCGTTHRLDLVQDGTSWSKNTVCIHVSPVSIFTFPLTVFISEMSDGEYLSRLKSRFCLSVWNAESVERAGFNEYSKLIYVLSSKLFGRMIG